MLTAAFLFLSIPGAAAPRASGEPVLRGLDPVELCGGREVAGDAARSLERFGATYVFSSDENRRRFEAEPARFELQMGGGCSGMGPLSGLCSAERFAVHEGRLYAFASDGCRNGFLAAPGEYVDRDEAPLDEAGLDRAAGRALLDQVLAGLGGAERVDAAKSCRWIKKAERESGGKRYATQESVAYAFPDGLRHESSWDTSKWFEVETAREGFRGPDPVETMHPEVRREVRRRFGREPIFLVRQRGREGFDVAAAGTRAVQGLECRELVVLCDRLRTRLFVDPRSGRVLAFEWRGRLDGGRNGTMSVGCSDFRDVRGLTLPHARQVAFNGEAVAHLSGTLDLLEVDADGSGELFRR